MKIRIIVFLALAVTTLLMCKYFSHPPSSSKVGVVVWLPDEYDQYVSEVIDISEQERKWLPADTTNYKRRYMNRELVEYLKQRSDISEEQKEGILAFNSLNVTLIVAGSDSRSLHNPEVCLTAQAWTIEKKVVSTLETRGGPLDIMNLHLKRTVTNANREVIKNEDGSDYIQRAIYTFWWIGPNNTTPYLESKTWLSLWNSVKTGETERWAYPSCMAYVLKDGGIDKAQEKINRFIIEHAPSFQKSLGATERDDAITPPGM